MTTAAADLDFVLAAVRRDDGAAEARAQAAAAVDDWQCVAALAVRHDVPWWVWRALPASGVPAAVRDALGDTVRLLAVRSLAGVGELLGIVRTLETAGVRVVSYKGPALAADVHGDVGARRFTDLDLLIDGRDRAAARQALMATGYLPPPGYTEREERFYSAWEGVSHFAAEGAEWPVEVHWRVQAPRYGPPQDPAAIVAASRRCAVGGGSVAVPAEEEQSVLLALHGVKHAWRSLLWVVDFANSVARDGFDWQRFDRTAAAWGVQRALHDALLVAHSLVALDVPPAVLARARGDVTAVRLADEAVHGLREDTETPNAGRDSTARYDLQWLGGPWAKARYLALAAALPTPRERQFARLPDALLALAYPVRAWRLVRQAVGGRQ